MSPLARWKHWVLFMLIAPTASMAAYRFGSLAAVGLRNQEERPPLPTINGLNIETQALDIGEVWETPRYTFRLTIQNVGTVTRTISRFQTTCGCLELEPSSYTIAPGHKAEFTGNLDLLRRLPYQWGVAHWPVSVRLDPVFEGDLMPTRGWEVKGTVRSRVGLTSPNLAFEDRCSHDGPRLWRKVRAKAYVQLKALLATVDPKFAQVRVEPSETSPGDYLIFVSPNPSLPIGRFRFEVQLQAVTLDDVVHPCSTIKADGEIQPSSRVIPRVVLLGEHPVPSESEADVTLRLPAKDWRIDHIEIDTAETLITQTGTESEEGVRFHIKQRIVQIGDHVSTIRIIVRKPDKQIEVVRMEVRYHGQSAPR